MAPKQKPAQAMETATGSAFQQSIQVGTNTDATQSTGVVTRRMARRAAISEAAARLRSASVPTRGRRSAGPRQSYRLQTKTSSLKSPSKDLATPRVSQSSRSESESVAPAAKRPMYGPKASPQRGPKTPSSALMNEEAAEKLQNLAIYTSPVFSFSLQDDSQDSEGSSSLRKAHSDTESSADFIVPVMTTGANTIEEQLAEMRKNMEMLMMASTEKDERIKQQSDMIAALDKKLGKLKKFEEEDEEEEHEKPESVHADDDDKNGNTKSLSLKKVQEMISEAFKSQSSGSSYAGHHYIKPYTKRIDSMQMPFGY